MGIRILKEWGAVMEFLSLPTFDEGKYCENYLSDESRVVLWENAAKETYEACCQKLTKAGFVKKEQEEQDHRTYSAWQKESTAVFLNWFSGTSQLQLVEEGNSSRFDFCDVAGEKSVEPRLTQVFLSDYGLSDLIRLPDGRLMIIDGGDVFAQDIDHLFERIQEDSPYEKPEIAAWILTHPHCDHYFCVFPFMEKYGEQVNIQKFIFNFPQADDIAHYPALAKEEPRFAKWLGVEHITDSQILGLFRERLAQWQIPVYTPHTGQRYRIGEAELWFCGSMDDTIHCSSNINAASLIFAMDLAGQRILFGGDGSFSAAALAERYAEELRCDILQIPHHGFGCGTEDGQIAAYKKIAPQVCLLPVQKRLAYTTFTTYREGTAYLMSRANVREMRTGEEDQILELPYTPPADGATVLEQNFTQGRDNAGARTWIFTDLRTDEAEDFWFSIMNSTYLPANISVELFFEDLQRKVVYYDIVGPQRGIFRICCMPNPEEDPESLWQQIPENTYFAVRLISDIPVVVSHRNHAAAYRSSTI